MAEDITGNKENKDNKNMNSFSARRKSRIAELVERAKGDDRSYRKYADDAGISSAALTRMRKGDYIPKPDTIEKLTSEKARPRGGVTFDEMMLAAGYAVERKDEVDWDLAENYSQPMESAENHEFETKGDAAIKSPIQKHEEENARWRQFRLAMMQFEEEASSIIVFALFNKKINADKDDAMTPASRSSRDLMLNLNGQPIAKWVFEFKYIDVGPAARRQFRSKAEMWFGWELFKEQPSDTKLSYVINDRDLYQYLERYEHKLAFRGELSVILLDMEEKKVAGEFYLSNYNEGDTSKEVYLYNRV